MFRIVSHEQGSRAWLDWRRGGVGGSDLTSLLGLTDYQDATPDKLFLEKLGLFKKEATFAMRRGILRESETRARVGAITRKKFLPGCAEHMQENWVRSSLDGIEQLPPHSKDRPDLIEIKWLRFQDHELAVEGFVPSTYLAQMQWQLLVTGLDRCLYCSASEHSSFSEADRLVIIPVAADAERQAELLDVAREFWDRVQAARLAMAAGKDPAEFMPKARVMA